MGRVIDLHLADADRRFTSKGTTPAPSAETQEKLAAALSNSEKVRHQICLLLEITTKAEHLVESLADQRLHETLLDKLWQSRRDLLLAFRNVSMMVDTLSSTANGDSPIATHPNGERMRC